MLASLTRPPMPGMPLNNSAATTEEYAMPTASLIPVNVSGNADGTTTSRMTSRREAPRARAASCNPTGAATTAAVVAAPVGLQEAARALGASGREVIRDVVVPSALPETFTGVRLAVGMAYSSVVAAELFNGLPGIGGLVKDASNYNNTPVVLVGIFAIGISGLIIDGLLRAIERRAVPWRGKI